MIERDNISTRELREELWSWIAALKPTLMMLQKGMNFPVSWPLCLLCKHSAPDFIKLLETWGSLNRSVISQLSVHGLKCLKLISPQSFLVFTLFWV